MEVRGYKAFNKDMTNRYGIKFEEGKIYTVQGEISFGNSGNGYHMCTTLADVFRYFDLDNVVVAEVIGFGKHKKYDDEYYGYYDMYSFENIYIERFLSREEIISIMLESSFFDVEKFLMTFRLDNEESIKFIDKFKGNYRVFNCILYYQYKVEDIYQLDYNQKKKRLRKFGIEFK